MISIIVCSKSESEFGKLKLNIEETIGVCFEVVCINNTNNQYNIFQAYNEGVKRSKGDILCFCHEDIFIHSPDWGKEVLKHFQDDNLGVIGVAGCSYLPKVPAPWWNNGLQNHQLINILQHYHSYSGNRGINKIGVKVRRDYNNPRNLETQSAVVVDGVWFCVRRELFETISFDEFTYPGYHFYDMDICLQIKTSYKSMKICVVYDIVIEHFSQGTLNREWVLAFLAFNEKWLDHKPFFSTENEKSFLDTFQHEIDSLLYFSSRMRAAGISENEIKQTIKKYLNVLEKKHKKTNNYMFLKCWSVVGYNFSNCTFFLLHYLKVFLKAFNNNVKRLFYS